jgi:uncharacterized membrane protein
MTQYEPDRIHQVTSVEKTSLGVDTKIAATLCYIPFFALDFVASVVWLISEPKDNRYLRFHAAQSIVFGSAFLVLNLVLWVGDMIPVIGGLFGLMHMLVVATFFLGSFFLMYCGYQKRAVRIPMLADYADRLLEKLDR